ncbi:LysR family transcriptional regulator ArgP [Ketogulonicigenium vulgare]|uniref:Transcriptional regulator protein, LysR family protein n=1 Tax=Ketogulonicigenium vulgare (strain WSH-001) TaxID=759362 RepID=F9Y598_KETVW|nr:ArgP/LysG family DNA-binding transcriptional regulator [Ketogulonicigenium vulgare]ADO43635.1 chromosome replication initiation inhibitor protein [Ketogulonicigenium vulgare Y25]AEM41903.1 transcriptional regulator protein, LysR family protein [Ketogulonicigenium vulgare WSH-001]ALJ82006.1 LysR family transcriptional regulator [Ketogulonicigenium vulgare]ANW34641.1 transcriptional regulator ArgP [Ketogulonicigenium vulgare]AOZ55667.1 chromosome replication initiation inhibitor protein [Keto
MLDYAAARAVALIVQTGSFEGAAHRLGVTPSAISQRVRHLEERLGTVLIQRGTPCLATAQGDWLCRHMEKLGMLEAELMQHLPALADGTSLPVSVHIAVNADSLGAWFLQAMAAFGQQNNTLLDIALDDQDHTSDWLRRGQVSAAVTADARAVQGCHIQFLGKMRYRATASPAYVARYFADGITPEALMRAPALRFNRKDMLQQQWAKQVFDAAPQLPTHWLPAVQGFVDAARLGIGWGMNPEVLIADDLASGRLVELVPQTPLDVPLYWQVSRLAMDGLAGLTRQIRAAAAEALI